MRKVLTAVSEKVPRELICSFLSSAGYETLETDDSLNAVRMSSESGLSAVVVDEKLKPYGAGETIRAIRRISDLPIVLLADSATDESARLISDAYLQKPFSLASLTKLLRDISDDRRDEEEKPQEHGGLVIDRSRSVAFIGTKKLDLTSREYDILELMDRHPGEIFSRERLLESIWGEGYTGDARTVDSHIARLRTKLGDWGIHYLKTVYGSGYKIDISDKTAN